MSTASEIIKRLGGHKAVADALGMDRSGVQRWTYDPPRGCGNRIPAKHWGALIQFATLTGKTLTAEELLAGLAKPARRSA